MRPIEIRTLHLPRRAILIYLLTIVLPVCVLLWLGIGSFDRQREASSETGVVAADRRPDIP